MTLSTGLSDHEFAHWLALSRAPGIGALGFQRLLNHFDSASAVFAADQGELRRLGLRAASLRYLQAPDWPAVEADLRWASQAGHTLLSCRSPLYPPLLGELADAPPLLYIKGDAHCLAQAQVAVVGSRQSSPGGRQNALRLAGELCRHEFLITSGLAYGIDAAAHEGALTAKGRTVAVLGSGLDRIYPCRHQALAARIAENGALVSELAPDSPPLAHHFPRRNRIISGLSLAILVVEAGERSGSLITARLALEQGRDVMAIPGALQNPLAAGCHRLIQDGALLVTSADDILNNLNGFMLKSPLDGHLPGGGGKTRQPLDELQSQVLYHIDYVPTPVDAIVAQSGLTIAEVSSILLALELLGYVSSAPGGTYHRLDN